MLVGKKGVIGADNLILVELLHQIVFPPKNSRELTLLYDKEGIIAQKHKVGFIFYLFNHLRI
jgi:hypothetical protein